MAVAKNFRDVGYKVNILSGRQLMNAGMLFRSGELNHVDTDNQLSSIKTIIALRSQEDPAFADTYNLKVSPKGKMNNYLVETDVFVEWIQRLYTTLSVNTRWPILLHCTAGKDRTGVAIALLLKSIGIPDKIIIKEYLLSEGQCYEESLGSILSLYNNLSLLQMSDVQRNIIIDKLRHHNVS